MTSTRYLKYQILIIFTICFRQH